MQRQSCLIWALLLILSLSINIRGETTISSPTHIEDVTDKSIEATTTTTEHISSSEPIITVSDSTTIADASTFEPTTTVSDSTTIADASTFEPTTTVSDSTTVANVVSSDPTTTVSDSTTVANVVSSDPTTTISDSTTIVNILEPTTTPVTESTTIVNVSESTTTNVPESTTIGSIDNTTIEISTTPAMETTTIESLKLDTTVETTTNLDKPSTDIESQDVKDFYPHLGKPKWAQIESSKARFLQNDANSSTNELIQEIIPVLAEYINNQTDDDITNIIIEKLKDKLDQTELNINDDDRKALRGTVKLVLKNLPIIIQTMVSSADKVGYENCPVKFTFYNNIYCIKFELNFESSFTPKTLPPMKSTEPSPTNISIESFKVFNPDHIDKPPTTWQQWLSPPPLHDQTSPTTNDPAVVCYYTNWAQYRNGPGRFYPENIDINLCTHINYAFAQLTDGVIAPYEWNDESTPWSTGMFARMMNLRKGPRPKILLAIGGWNHGSGRFSDMVRNDTKRATFVTTTIIFLQKHKFDGLDLDWEYPGSREGSRPTDKADFVKLVTELKAAFLPYSLLLTAAVGAGKPTIDAGYDIPKVCQQLDFINLMAYDLHGSWETQTGLHTALYGHQNDTALNKQLTVDWAVRYWIKGGCPPAKIVLGLALYGRTFRLASSLNTKVGAPAVGPGSAGLYTGEAGFLGYYEICTRVQNQGWTKVFDDEQKASYAYKGVEWVGYEDAYSLGFKIAYAKDMGLGGIMFWAPDLDDFTGASCNEGKYPLMNTALNLYRGQTQWTTSTQPPTTSSTTTTVQSTLLPDQKRVVCYYTNWAQYRPDGGKFVPENLDASLCTHIIYAFAVLKDSKLAAFEWNDEDTDWSKGMYSRVMQLKSTNVKPKILLAVGGWNFGSGPFSDMVGDQNLRSQFVQQATQFIRDHQFDGLDLDWEYPGSREGSRPQDKQLFTSLVKELKAAFEPYNFLLTAAVGAGASTIRNAYEIDKIAPYLDFINLMTYDLHGGGWENFTGLHTALYARPEEDEIQITLNQNWAVNYWIQQGMPKEKISMGLATYGRTYTLANSSNTGIGAPSTGPGQPGKYTREPGFLSYYEICEKLNSGLWTSKYDDVQKSMYAYGEGMWVGYDNIDTMTIRANYIIGKDLGGVMIWAPDLDDFSGKFCNQGQYPLVKTIVNLIRTGIIVPIDIPTVPTSTVTATTVVVAPTTTTTTTTTTVATATTTTTAITTSTTSAPFLLSPPPHATIPSVVCMTIINPLVFQTIDVKLCSHLILVQSVTDTDVFQSTLSSDTLDQLKTMKTTNPKLQIFYSILGRWKPAHLNLIRNDQSRQDFNQKIKQYLIDNNLDGFDIDWTIQANQISALTDKYLLSTWLLELRNAFAPNQLSLSIGITADKTVLDNSYDFNKISGTVDFIRLMAFDWPSSNVTAFINPLLPANDDPTDNIKWAVNYLIALGIPPEQISLGIPTHGRWFGLANGNQNTVGSPIIGSAMPVAYSDICKLLKNSNNYVQKYNQQTRSSYAYNIQRKQWISFDTVNDVALIARFAKLEAIGGVTLSAVGMDDIDGQCGNGPYPLLHAASGTINSNPTDSSQSRNVAIRPQNLWKQKSVFCSVSPKADEYSGLTQFTLDKINPYLCTHLLINSHSSLLTPSLSDQLKNANPNLKILLTFNADEDGTIEQWKEEMKKKKTDGINIYINANSFSTRVADLIKAIQPALTDGQLFTVSFQLPSDPTQQVSFFQVLELHKFVDYLLVLPFDGKSIANFKQIQPWNSLATFVAANPDKNIGDFSMMSTLMFILSSGVPREKLILGIATYGLSFLLENEDHYLIGDKISGQGLPGHITNTTGLLASYEICERIESDGYDRFLSNESIVVVAHKKQDFITFDDTQPLQLSERFILNGTVELKATFIKNAQIAGVLVHSIDMDDYTGSSCHRGPFPITTVVSRLFSTSMPFPGSPPPPPPSSRNIPGTKKLNPCAGIKTKDLIADENDCQYYYVCMPHHHEPVAHLQCPNNMHFSPRQKACSQQEFEFPCSSKSKFNTIHRSAPHSEVSLPKAEIPFVCPTPDGIFPDSSDCTQFFACSNNLVISMKCPLKTKFNPQLNRCDWTSSSCP